MSNNRGEQYTFNTFIRRGPEKVWWLGIYEWSLDPTRQRDHNPKHDPTCDEWEVLTKLAKQAGKIVKNVKESRPPALIFDEDDFENRFAAREDDIWYATLFHLAWMELPESPLRARTWFSPGTPPEYRDSQVIQQPISGEEASKLPIGLRSFLKHDPFTSSTYAIDALVSGTHLGFNLPLMLGNAEGNVDKRIAELGLAASRQEEIKLSPKQQDGLVAMLELRCFDSDSRKPIEEIAKRAAGDHVDPETFKQAMTTLRRVGLVGTKVGRGGGCWLTNLGKVRAEKLSR